MKRILDIIKKGIKYGFFFIRGIILYVLLSIGVSFITVNKDSVDENDSETVYLDTNGVHSSIILPIALLSEELQKGIDFENIKFVKYGWGDKNFYLNIPTWNDFKFKYAFGALFLDNPTVMHVKKIRGKQKKWITVKLNQNELKKLNTYIEKSFKTDEKGEKIKIIQNIYGKRSSFYEATGSYSSMKTCNTWVNNGFKESGLKASYWTILDIGLLDKYRND